MEEVTFEDPRQAHLVTGMLNETLMDNDEKLFQKLWKTYFKSICIKERWNPRKHRQDMPVRYWKYLTEAQKTVLPDIPHLPKTRHVPEQNSRHYNDLYPLSLS